MNAMPHSHPIPDRAVIRAADFPEALAVASRDQSCLVEVFVQGWSDVDAYRAQAAALGLSARVGVHHRAALEVLVRLGVRPASPLDPPAAPSGVPRLFHQFVHAASALCRARFIVGIF